MRGGGGRASCRFGGAQPPDTEAQFSTPPPQWGGLDLDSRNSGCARLGGEVGLPLGVVVEEVAVLVVLVRRHCHAVRAAVRRAVDGDLQCSIFRTRTRTRTLIQSHIMAQKPVLRGE